MLRLPLLIFSKIRWFFAYILTFLLTGIIRFLILFVPFKHLASLLGRQGEESKEILSDRTKLKALKVGIMVNRIAEITPWESKCFVRALSAFIILHIFQIDSTVYLGIRKNKEGGLLAHAWIKCGGIALTGYEEMNDFHEVAKYTYLHNRRKK